MSENRKKAEWWMAQNAELAMGSYRLIKKSTIEIRESLAALLDSVQADGAKDERLAIIKLILGGSFLHEMSPEAKFAREVVEAIRRERDLKGEGL